jgi:hypothetical protein
MPDDRRVGKQNVRARCHRTVIKAHGFRASAVKTDAGRVICADAEAIASPEP